MSHLKRIEKEIKTRFTESELIISSNAKAFLFGEYLIFHAGTSLITGIDSSRMVISFKFYSKTEDNEEVSISRIYEKEPSGMYIDLTKKLTKDWIDIIKISVIKWKDALKKVLEIIKHPLYNDEMINKIDNLCIDLYIITEVIYRGGLGSSAVIASILSAAVMNKLGIISDQLTPGERTLIFLVAIMLEDAYHHSKRYIKNLKGIAGGFSVIPCIYPLDKGQFFELDLLKFFQLQKDERSQFKEIPIDEFITKIYESGDLISTPMLSKVSITPSLLEKLHFTVYFSGTRSSTQSMIKKMAKRSPEFWEIYNLTFQQMSQISQLLTKKIQQDGTGESIKEIKTLFDMLQTNFSSLGVVPIDISRTLSELNLLSSQEKLYFGKVLGASGGGSFLLITTKEVDDKDEEIVYKFLPNGEKISSDLLKNPSRGLIFHELPTSTDFDLKTYY